jgi:hypothetical protein
MPRHSDAKRAKIDIPQRFMRSPAILQGTKLTGSSDRWRRATHSTNLTDLTYFIAQRRATQPKTLAYVIDVNFEFEKQIGVPYWDSRIVD